MPRTARASAANVCYHVLNRDNNRAWDFHLSACCQRPNSEAIRQCVQRNAPFGSEPRVLQTAASLGLQSSLGRRGNPRLGRRTHDGL